MDDGSRSNVRGLHNFAADPCPLFVTRLIREPSGADFERHVNDWNTDARFPDFS